jgi:hypothetical protein
MKKYLFVATISLLLFASIALADIPKYISVQGILTNANGGTLPSSVSYKLLFKIYTYESCPGGSDDKWNETKDNVNIDDNGFFNVNLDFTTSTIGFNESYWLEVQVWNTTSSSWNVLCPHIRMTSTSYAFSAGRLLPTSYPISINLTNKCAGASCPEGRDAIEMLADTNNNEAVIKTNQPTFWLWSSTADNWANLKVRNLNATENLYVDGNLSIDDTIISKRGEANFKTYPDWLSRWTFSSYNYTGYYVDNLILINGKVYIRNSMLSNDLDANGNNICLTNGCRNSWPSGIGGSGTDNYLSKWTSGGTSLTNSIIYDTGSNVGIGTNNPSANVGLDIKNSESLGNRGQIIADTYYLRNTTGLAYAPSDFAAWIDNNNGYLILNQKNGGLGVKFNIPGGPGGSTKMSILADGNVGIGTSTPGAKLDVSGTIRSTDVSSPPSGVGLEFYYSPGVGNALITSIDRSTSTYKPLIISAENISLATHGAVSQFINSNGNVGIGTTSPTAKLDVNGTIKIGKERGSYPPSLYCTADAVGSIEYREYCISMTFHAILEMCMRTGDSTYAYQIIKEVTWVTSGYCVN